MSSLKRKTANNDNTTGTIEDSRLLIEMLIPTLTLQNPEDIIRNEQNLREAYDKLSELLVAEVEPNSGTIEYVSAVCVLIIKVLITLSNQNIGIFHNYFYIIYLLTKVCKNTNAQFTNDTQNLHYFLSLITGNTHKITIVSISEINADVHGLCIEVVRGYIGVLINIAMLRQHFVSKELRLLSVVDLEKQYRIQMTEFASYEGEKTIGVELMPDHDLFFALYEEGTIKKMAFPTHILFHLFNRTQTTKVQKITYNTKKCLKVKGSCFELLRYFDSYLNYNSINSVGTYEVQNLELWAFENIFSFIHKYSKNTYQKRNNIVQNDEYDRMQMDEEGEGEVEGEGEGEGEGDYYDPENEDMIDYDENEESEYNEELEKEEREKEENEKQLIDRRNSIIDNLAFNTFVGLSNILADEKLLLDFYTNLEKISRYLSSFVKYPEVLPALSNIKKMDKPSKSIDSFLLANNLVVKQYMRDNSLVIGEEEESKYKYVPHLVQLDGVFPGWVPVRINDKAYQQTDKVFTKNVKSSMTGMVVFENGQQIPNYIVQDYIYSLNNTREEDSEKLFPTLVWRGHIKKCGLLNDKTAISWLFLRPPSNNEEETGLYEMKMMALYPPTQFISVAGNKISHKTSGSFISITGKGKKTKDKFYLTMPAESTSFQTNKDNLKVIDTIFTFLHETQQNEQDYLDNFENFTGVEVVQTRVIRVQRISQSNDEGSPDAITESLWLVNFEELYKKAVVTYPTIQSKWSSLSIFKGQRKEQLKFITYLKNVDRFDIIFEIGTPIKASVMVSLSYIMSGNAKKLIDTMNTLIDGGMEDEDDATVDKIKYVALCDQSSEIEYQWHGDAACYLNDNLLIRNKALLPKDKEKNNMVLLTQEAWNAMKTFFPSIKNSNPPNVPMNNPFVKLLNFIYTRQPGKDCANVESLPFNSLLQMYWGVFCMNVYKPVSQTSESKKRNQLIVDHNLFVLNEVYKLMIEKYRLFIPAVFEINHIINLKDKAIINTVVSGRQNIYLPTFDELMTQGVIIGDNKTKSVLTPYLHLNNFSMLRKYLVKKDE